MAAFFYEGTVSEGTLDPNELIPKFLAVLDSLDPAEAALIRADAEALGRGEADGYDELDLLAELEDALNDCAPEGYYFGAHWGDGADFGFWPEENDDE